MTQINSGNRREAVSLRSKEAMSSMSIALTDYIPDASWRLRVEVEVHDGGRFALGAVDTVPTNALAVRNPNRVVAICSVPGARNWYVYHELLAGTPTPGHSEIYADIKLSEVEEYGAGCCPIAPIPGTSVDVGDTDNQGPVGGPPIGTRLTLYTGSGFALAADAAYLGVGADPTFLQLHDAGASDPVSTASMIGIGYPYALPTDQTLILEWAPGRRFKRGFTLALSLAQNTFVGTAETISAFGQWSVWHD